MNIIAETAETPFAPEIYRDPSLKLTHEALREVIATWRDLAGDRPMPARADIRPRDFLRHLPDLAMVDVQRAPLRLRYRLVGTNICNAVGRELTGCWYDELYPAGVMAQVEQVYGWIVRHRRALRTTGMALFFDRRMYSYEVVNMPLSADGEAVDMVLVAMKFYLAEVPSGR